MLARVRLAPSQERLMIPKGIESPSEHGERATEGCSRAPMGDDRADARNRFHRVEATSCYAGRQHDDADQAAHVAREQATSLGVWTHLDLQASRHAIAVW